jgi:hypothetical protein
MPTRGRQPPPEEPSSLFTSPNYSQLGGRYCNSMPEEVSENATRGGRRRRTGKRRTGKRRTMKRKSMKRKSMRRRR